MLEHKLTHNPDCSGKFVEFEPTQELLIDLERTYQLIHKGRFDIAFLNLGDRFSTELGYLVMDASERKEPVICLRVDGQPRSFIRTHYTGAKELDITGLDFLFYTKRLDGTDPEPDDCLVGSLAITDIPKPNSDYIVGPKIELVYADFRAEAKATKLRLPDNTNKPSYRYNLGEGIVVTENSVQAAWELVQLARKYSSSDSYGEHIGILRLITNKDMVNGKDTILWKRPYDNDSKYSDVINLGRFLSDNGCDLKDVIGSNKYQDIG